MSETAVIATLKVIGIRVVTGARGGRIRRFLEELEQGGSEDEMIELSSRGTRKNFERRQVGGWADAA
jgi:hypothetical protein